MKIELEFKDILMIGNILDVDDHLGINVMCNNDRVNTYLYVSKDQAKQLVNHLQKVFGL